MKKLLYLALTAALANTFSIDAMKHHEDYSTKFSDACQDDDKSKFESVIIDSICQGNLDSFHDVAHSNQQIMQDLCQSILLKFANPTSYDTFARYLKKVNPDTVDTILQDEVFLTALKKHCYLIALDRLNRLDQLSEFLHEACKTNHLSVVKVLFAMVEINDISKLCSMQDRDGATALYTAANKNYPIIVKFILDMHTAEEAQKLRFIQDRRGNTPLHTATSSNSTEIVQALFKKLTAEEIKTLCSIKNNQGDTALHIAVERNHRNVTKLIFEQFTTEQVKELCSIKNNDGDTPLHIAARWKKAESVTCIRDKLTAKYLKELCSMKNNLAQTPLDIATMYANTAITELLNKAMNPRPTATQADTIPANTMRSDNNTMDLEEPRERQQKETEQHKIQANTQRPVHRSIPSLQSMLEPTIITLVTNSIRQGDLDSFHAVTKNEGQVIQDLCKKILLDFASSYHDLKKSDTFNVILEDQVFIATLNKHQSLIEADRWKSFLHYACADNLLSAVKIVFAAVEADDMFQLCAMKNSHGDTALQTIALYDYADIAQFIFEQFDDHQIYQLCAMQDQDGFTLLYTAAAQDLVEITNLILEKLTIDQIYQLCGIQNNNGNTLLYSNTYNMIKPMLEQFSPEQVYKLCVIKNNDGNTPLHMATTYNSTPIVKFILSKLTTEQIKELCFMKNKNGKTPLQIAAALSGRTAIVSLIEEVINK